MDQEIINCLQKVSLTEKEDEGTLVDEKDVCKEVEECLASSVGRIYMITKNSLSEF